LVKAFFAQNNFMFDEVPENLLSLEQSLRQTRKDQKQLISKREELKADSNKISPEVERITQEIDTLELLAKKGETAIYNVLKTLRLNKS
jgi:uncharacterized protein YlxW (UPF0749 family)